MSKAMVGGLSRIGGFRIIWKIRRGDIGFGDAVVFAGPGAKIKELASFGTKRAPWILFPGRGLPAYRALEVHVFIWPFKVLCGRFP